MKLKATALSAIIISVMSLALFVGCGARVQAVSSDVSQSVTSVSGSSVIASSAGTPSSSSSDSRNSSEGSGGANSRSRATSSSSQASISSSSQPAPPASSSKAQEPPAPVASSSAPASSSQTPPPAPPPPPPPPPAPSVDVGALIAEAHGYAAANKLGVNDALYIGGAGFENPVEITGKTAAQITEHLHYQIDMIVQMWKNIPEYDPEMVVPAYKIVQEGTRIYVLYG